VQGAEQPAEAFAASGNSLSLTRSSERDRHDSERRKAQPLQITHAQVGELLELNRFETDGFLKNAQAFRLSESEEFSSDLESLRRIAK